MGIFLFLGAATASLAGETLLWRGTVLDRIWALNPRAFQELAPFGTVAGILFLLLALVLAMAGVGWFRRKLWGWWMAVGIMATQVLGGLIHIATARFAQGAVGTAIPGLLLVYLLRRRVLAEFRRGVA